MEMTDLDQILSPTGSDPADDDAFEAERAGSEPGEGVLGDVQRRTRDLAGRIAYEVQDHPLRTLAIAGLVGFLIASSMKHRNLSALLRSGAGIAAAMALREIAARGLSRVDVGAA
jgi:ElaB/YqjD/DUF883 family membrane-anchored ribosome-binding protein